VKPNVTFDPFGDDETQGYLRNIEREKDLAIVKRLEHTSFLTGIEAAFAALAKRKEFRYSDVLQTHKTLFDAV
jgi:cell filamentation protein